MKTPMKRKIISSRRDSYITVTWLSAVILQISRIPLTRMIGNNGMAYFSAANEICLLFSGSLAYGLSEAVSSLVRYRVKRAQYKGAGKVLGSALIMGAVLGLAISAVIWLGAHALTDAMKLPLAQMAVELMAPAMFFFVLTGVFRGYFQGNGMRGMVMHSQILCAFFMIIGSLTGAGVLHRYGGKVSALLQNSDYAAAYGAMGASIGLLCASLVCFLHALVMYGIFHRSLKGEPGRISQTGQDTGGHIFRMLAGTGIIHTLFRICFHCLPLADQFLFLSYGNENGDLTGQWGAYYGRCMVIMGIVCGMINLICLRPVRKIIGSMERNENRYANDRLGALIHQCAILCIPAAVFIAVLAENLLDLLFSGNNQRAAAWMLAAVLIIIFYVFATVLMEILIKNHRFQYVILSGAGALLLHIFMLVLLLKTVKAGIYAVIISTAVFYAAVTAIGFVLVSRLFRYTQEWIRTFVITLAAAAVSGLVTLLLNRLLITFAGTVAATIASLAVGIVIYLILLVITRAFRRDELEEIAGGKLFEKLAQLLHY